MRPRRVSMTDWPSAPSNASTSEGQDSQTGAEKFLRMLDSARNFRFQDSMHDHLPRGIGRGINPLRIGIQHHGGSSSGGGSGEGRSQNPEAAHFTGEYNIPVLSGVGLGQPAIQGRPPLPLAPPKSTPSDQSSHGETVRGQSGVRAVTKSDSNENSTGQATEGTSILIGRQRGIKHSVQVPVDPLHAHGGARMFPHSFPGPGS